MMRRNQEGKAKVSFTIDSNGNVAQATVVEASDPDFGFAAQAMIEAWKFESAKKAGKSVLSALAKEQTFSLDMANADNADYSESAKELKKAIETNQLKLYPQNELDLLPAVRYQVLPVYPRSLFRQGLQGTAKLEFIVDQSGMVQWPRILSASKPEFGWAAATAIKRWIFEPPKKNAEPVYGRFVMPIDFNAPTAPVNKN
jgi:TonB family protein